MRKLLALVTILAVVFTVAGVWGGTALTSSPVAARGAPLVVDDDKVECPDAVYTTIGGALGDASAGNRIHVCAGVYNEPVVINKNGITLKGVPGAILDGDTPINFGAVNGITISAGVSGVTVHGFEIRDYGNQGIRGDGTIAAPLSGITLRNLNIHDVGDHAIDILHSDDVQIKHVTIVMPPYIDPVSPFGCLFGFPVSPEAIRLQDVHGVQVTNVAVDGGFIGVNFALDPNGGETNGVVRGSTFAHNFDGVLIADSSDATIRGNEITGACSGIRVGFSTPLTGGIRLVGNELFENFAGISAFVFGQRISAIEIKGNKIHDNDTDGVLLLNVHESEISENEVLDNGRNGIALFDSRDNEVAGNTALGNGTGGPLNLLELFFGITTKVDMFQDDPTSIPNIWSSNICGTSLGTGIDCP